MLKVLSFAIFEIFGQIRGKTPLFEVPLFGGPTIMVFVPSTEANLLSMLVIESNKYDNETS